ncbi:MAG: DUF6913 domain-containing protein [Cytophagaceae bacterium]
MIKKISYLLKNFYYLNAHQIKRQATSYSKAVNIGVLIKNPDPNFNKVINEFIAGLQKDGKQVQAICFIDKSLNRIYDFDFTELTNNEIEWNGDFKQEKVNKFTKTEFDYLYCINISPFLPYENILLRSQAKFRIGYHFKNKRKLFELMIDLKPEEKIDVLVRSMMIYTKKLESQ